MFDNELKYMIEASKIASKNIMNYYTKGFHTEYKEDDSPVTEADKTSDALIRDFLKKYFPSYSFLTEESKDDKSRLNNDFVFIIDPLDGTEDFVHKDGQFTINIALCYKHEIVVGVINVPATNEIYYATKNKGAYKIDQNGNLSKLHVSDKVNDLTCFTSVHHLAQVEIETIEKHKDKITNVIKKGSSLKACLIAEGKGEISYRLTQGTKEWDTAAFDIIVKESGGYVLKLDGKPMVYNREEVRNLEPYIIVNKLENILL